MADKKEKVGFFASIKKYFREVKSEMKKIVWPTKSQVVNNTLIVIAVSLVAAVLIFGLDTVFGLVLKLIYKNV
jgi:preprotein translocase subunit SecE